MKPALADMHCGLLRSSFGFDVYDDVLLIGIDIGLMYIGKLHLLQIAENFFSDQEEENDEENAQKKEEDKNIVADLEEYGKERHEHGDEKYFFEHSVSCIVRLFVSVQGEVGWEPLVFLCRGSCLRLRPPD